MKLSCQQPAFQFSLATQKIGECFFSSVSEITSECDLRPYRFSSKGALQERPGSAGLPGLAESSVM
jgi:hypothetical protein